MPRPRRQALVRSMPRWKAGRRRVRGSDAMKIDGQCHCGHVTYEAEIDPAAVSICHCTDCQALTGSAFRVTVSTAAEKVRITGPQPKLYTKSGDNGRKRLHYFC